METHVPIGGWAAEGFEPVREAFEQNFTDLGETGASCSVYHQGRKVVDLWGGWCDSAHSEPWRADTLVLTYTVSMGMAATVLAHLHAGGLLDYGTPVCAYWPEFAQADKGKVTVEQLISHQAGLLCSFPWEITRLEDRTQLPDLLAQAAPAWQPGAYHGFHAVSLGLYVDELVRRIDPQGRDLATYFQNNIGEPLALDYHFGLSDKERPRAAAVSDGGLGSSRHAPKDLPLSKRMLRLNPKSQVSRSFQVPGVRRLSHLNDAPYHRAALPSLMGFGTARAVARTFCAFAMGSADCGLDERTRAILSKPAHPPENGSHDRVLGMEMVYGKGFVKAYNGLGWGSETAFAAPGFGGSLGYGDPDLALGFAYLTRALSPSVLEHAREKRVREALARCLAS